jgi:hypothetical protein
MEERNLLDEKDAVVAAEKQELWLCNLGLWFWLKCFFALLCILIVDALLNPVIWNSTKKMDMTQAISNSKQIYLVLLDFENDMGKFPDDETAAKAELHAFRGPHSNDYLGQLIAGGYTKTEQIFYAYDKRYPRKPDDLISPPEQILQKGECGFGYVMIEEKGKERGLSSKDNGGLPLVVAPIVNSLGVFETKSYAGRGVYLRVDGSARNERLDSNNKVRVGPLTLFDTGTGTVWGTELKPVILLPER